MNKIFPKSYSDYPGSTREYLLDCIIFYKRKTETKVKDSIYFVKTYPTLVGTYATVTALYAMLYLGEKRSYNKARKQVLATLKDKKRKRIIELLKEVNKMKKSQTNVEMTQKMKPGLINEDIRTMNDKLENIDHDIQELTKKIQSELKN
eukprot:gene10596-3114_t